MELEERSGGIKIPLSRDESKLRHCAHLLEMKTIHCFMFDLINYIDFFEMHVFKLSMHQNSRLAVEC